MCPVGGMAKFSDALGVQFDYESGSIGCLRSATAVCLYREGHQHREIMVPRSSGGIDWIGSSRSIQVIDLFGIIGENFLFVMDGRRAKHGGTRAQCRVRFCSWRLKVTSATADGTMDV